MGYRGNSLKLKAKKGVGFGRALPGVFGFDNGVTGWSTNSYFSIPSLLNTYLPDDFCMEVFFKSTTVQNRFISIGGAGSQGINLGSAGDGTINFGTPHNAAGYGYASNLLLQSDGSLQHIVASASRSLDYASKSSIYKNGGAGTSINGQDSGSTQGKLLTIGSDGKYGEPILITAAKLGIGSYQYQGGTGSGCSGKWDEFRMYSKALTKAQAKLNWNDGYGNSPSETEYLMIWYRFDYFEMLDFSAAQDGSDMKLGIRDHSGNNRHCIPVNLITDPANPNYVLKPF